MLTVQYRCNRTNVNHTEQCGNEEDAYMLMEHVNADASLRGIAVTGSKKFFCGLTGTFYINKPGNIGWAVGKEKKINV
jgi:hypothetical protein